VTPDQNEHFSSILWRSGDKWKKEKKAPGRIRRIALVQPRVDSVAAHEKLPGSETTTVPGSIAQLTI
jgi:hypothetical protein